MANYHLGNARWTSEIGRVAKARLYTHAALALHSALDNDAIIQLVKRYRLP